ncbi:glycosyltransferase [Halopiger aswanensis]|uniref:Glycosyltransferase involved in cell wall biosynthesis n=1 Tax=Halopiger aswanensis TaxID=148449 RepID=A0A3R7EHT3_9EURY|nr:glycosyltransferase [Halopiger aswanensis]RKD98092.1 glycosyltransferase involved in cell wall biosynthesis [Halopiger aswanensis]
MNIVYYLGHFPKLSESFVLNEIYELEQNGHNVAVCALNKPDENIVHEEFNDLNIPINYIPRPSFADVTEIFSTKALHPRILKNTFYRASPKYHAANLFWAKECIKFVDSLGWQPDHFHSHFAGLSKFGAQYASEYYQVPFTITTHASGLYKEPVDSYTTSLLQQANRIITISEYNKDYIQEQFAPNTPIDIVRAGIRPGKFAPTEATKPNRVLTISRFVEKKGFPYALKAVKIATEEIPELEYHIIGSGNLESDLVQMVEQLGIEENVVFLDNVNDQRLVTELDEARCFLLPCVVAESGDRDGIPVALMEAMAMKTPPVSTTVSGIPELIDHEQNGLLTEPRNPEATSKAIVSLLEAGSEWTAYAERAREKVAAEFNIEKEAEKLEAAFRSTQYE